MGWVVSLTDFALFLRLKIFGPWTILAPLILIPVNLSGNIIRNLTNAKEIISNEIDSLSISNIEDGSQRYDTMKIRTIGYI